MTAEQKLRRAVSKIIYDTDEFIEKYGAWGSPDEFHEDTLLQTIDMIVKAAKKYRNDKQLEFHKE